MDKSPIFQCPDCPYFEQRDGPRDTTIQHDRMRKHAPNTKYGCSHPYHPDYGEIPHPTPKCKGRMIDCDFASDDPTLLLIDT